MAQTSTARTSCKQANWSYVVNRRICSSRSFLEKVEGTASAFSFLVDFMPKRNCAAISVPGSKQFSSKCLLQRTEFPVGFHFARVRCTCFVHFSPMLGSLGNLKRLTRSRCVLEYAAATQWVGIVLELSFSWWRMRNHTHKGIWIFYANRKWKRGSLSRGFEETRVRRDLKNFLWAWYDLNFVSKK